MTFFFLFSLSQIVAALNWKREPGAPSKHDAPNYWESNKTTMERFGGKLGSRLYPDQRNKKGSQTKFKSKTLNNNKKSRPLCLIDLLACETLGKCPQEKTSGADTGPRNESFARREGLA
ncbi:hypothetical protein B0T24DRAFT_45699 [Lasiosphaeria ovina]|uniref:Secreted protein n=1 Tax=Lasiosphaeria ovina TaxID=92902 RepID=A0AAE0NKR9_9PEZI|nr:hypothetical protein B0T24DRAFT_45699 [Lasiosphaeria ovina]